MERILDAPMSPRATGEKPNLRRQGTDVVAHVRFPRLSLLAVSNRYADAAKSFPFRLSRQIFRDFQLVIGNLIFSTMTAQSFRELPRFDLFEIVLHLCRDVIDYGLVKLPLIPLEGQDIISSAVDDLRRNGRLAARRIDRYHRTRNIDLIQ